MSVATTGNKDDDDDDDDDEVLLNIASTINNVAATVSAQVVGMPQCKERFWNICALQLYNLLYFVHLLMRLTISTFLLSFAIIPPASPRPSYQHTCPASLY